MRVVCFLGVFLKKIHCFFSRGLKEDGGLSVV